MQFVNFSVELVFTTQWPINGNLILPCFLYRLAQRRFPCCCTWKRKFLQRAPLPGSQYEYSAAHAVTTVSRALLGACVILVLCFTYVSTLMVQVTRSSEAAVDFQRTTRSYIPEDRTLHKQLCKNLRAIENALLRRIPEPKKQRMTGEQRQLLIEKLHNWLSSPSMPTVRRINKNDDMRHICRTHKGDGNYIQNFC
jgi:hypothetical protein